MNVIDQPRGLIEEAVLAFGKAKERIGVFLRPRAERTVLTRRFPPIMDPTVPDNRLPDGFLEQPGD